MDFKMFVKILDRHEKMRLEKEIQKDKEANNLLTDTEKLMELDKWYGCIIYTIRLEHRPQI